MADSEILNLKSSTLAGEGKAKEFQTPAFEIAKIGSHRINGKGGYRYCLIPRTFHAKNQPHPSIIIIMRSGSYKDKDGMNTNVFTPRDEHTKQVSPRC
ncbi:hypothetical protein E3N88_04329 [Mikania micrantha]|uniref:Uncharacterized protein n=1 Tax=Mikania micrantha TaxID=192012 RepID=A0A5N6PW99_9ASTR|nr:hypothetical protein E3N88_04329 [Mikania micrantha]